MFALKLTNRYIYYSKIIRILRGISLLSFLVPAKPRILTSSEDESSSYVSIVHSVADEASVKLDLHSENPTEVHSIQPEMSSTNEAKLLTETTSFCNDWFSIVGSNEHSSTKKYIQEKLGDDFSHSTDSSSNEEN